MTRFSRQNLTLALLLSIAALPGNAAAVGTEFTYQGRLDKNDAPANATCSFSFTLWDAATAGTLVGGPVSVSNLAIDDGLFTTKLDFGAAFNGSPRWIEIQVQCAGDGNYTQLSPRQAITSVPYSVRSAFAENGGSGGSQWISNGPDLTYSGGGVGITGSSSPFASGKGVFLEGGLPGWANLFAYDYNTFTPQNLLLNSPGGQVAVGTTSPAARLHSVTSTGVEKAIFGQNLAGGWGVVGDSNNGAPGTGIGVYGRSTTGNGVRGTYTGLTGAYTAGVYGLNNANDGNAFGVQGVAYTGVGIRGESTEGSGVQGVATTAGGYGGYFTNTAGGVALRTSGKAQVSSLEILGGADLVEGFDAGAHTLEPGTVVVIDEVNSGQVRASRDPYDRKVAGVVSGAGGVQAGIRLGQEGVLDGETPIAMTGRVYVKCSSENGPIAAGDLLTTSSTRGLAMRATDQSRANGAVIGKAMSSLDARTGLVLVLVNLQ